MKAVIYPLQKFSSDNIRKLPQTPGIYIYYDKNKSPLYVGKSKNLRDRVSSYLMRNIIGKTKIMVSQIEYFTFIPVITELESLLLEAYLIKKYQTKYNLVLKDDKSPLYIVITKDKYPLVLAIRKSQISAYRHPFIIGPFLSSTIVRKVLRNIRKVFPYAQHKIGHRACIYNQIGQCNPCPNDIEKITDRKHKEAEIKRYKKNISYIKLTLSGNSLNLLNKFRRNLIKSSVNEEYEQALAYKKMVDGLNYLTQPINDSVNYVENPNLSEDIKLRQLESLKSILSQNGLNINSLNLIEAFDISHISGTFPVASLVALRNGQIDKSMYKRFKIRVGDVNDDVKSMSEIAGRRLNHLEDWGKPDLVIVDGGKGQINAFRQQFSQKNIPVVGIAKRFETLIIPITNPFNKNVLSYSQIKLKGDSLYIVQRIRDEAHRFANTYHNKLLRKSLYNLYK